ncbi:hypothetical protein, partial [Limnobacter sp.]|uniref:hypothetical protein n=1 Tax=Limnobacter sp. TaxID=2003368 RepID=UPI002736A457
ELSKNIDKLIDLLPQKDVEQLFYKQLLKPSFQLQSFMLDHAAKIGFERSVRFERPYECYRVLGDPGAERYALYRLDSEGSPRFVKYIDGPGSLGPVVT